MDNEILKCLYDIQEAARNVNRFVEGKSIQYYQSDQKTRLATERLFEIIGEALKRIQKKDEEILADIDGWRGAISFRNILAHGYDHIDDDLVWDIIQEDLPTLTRSIDRMLGENW